MTETTAPALVLLQPPLQIKRLHALELHNLTRLQTLGARRDRLYWVPHKMTIRIKKFRSQE